MGDIFEDEAECILNGMGIEHPSKELLDNIRNRIQSRVEYINENAFDDAVSEVSKYVEKNFDMLKLMVEVDNDD